MYRKIHYLVALIVTSLFLLICLSSSAQVIVSHQTVGLSRDAVAIQNGTMTYDENAKTWYYAYRDSVSIHVLLKIHDIVQQRKIVMNGMELWVGTKGKKNKTTGIEFPLSYDEKSTSEFVQTADQSDRFGKLSAMLASKSEMKLVGFNQHVNGMRNINDTSGPSAWACILNDTLIYVACIPFKAFDKIVSPGSSVIIGIVEKGMMPMGAAGAGMPGDMEGGGPPGSGVDGPPSDDGQGGANTQGPPPGEPPPNEETMQRIFQDSIIWFKIN
ncbi:MAG TPA: hypothetical protein VMT76_02065 [Puia sp.]|nr:hypothetical protein [Puia sp.]